PAGAVGQALVRPLHRGGHERFLNGVLGVVKAAVPPRDVTEDLRRQSAQQALDVRHRLGLCITGRTWISLPIGLPPGPGAAEVLAAISIARSSDSTSISQ